MSPCKLRFFSSTEVKGNFRLFIHQAFHLDLCGVFCSVAQMAILFLISTPAKQTLTHAE